MQNVHLNKNVKALILLEAVDFAYRPHEMPSTLTMP